MPEVIAGYWQGGERKLAARRRDRDRLPDRRQRPPRGRRGVQEPGPRRARYREIADGGRDAFYKGDDRREARRVLRAKSAGCSRTEDFADHTSEWVEPVKTTYRGYDVWELPPPGQGIAALQMLNLLERLRPEEAGPDVARLLAPARRGEEARVRRPGEVLRRPGVRQGAGRGADLEGVRRRRAAS